MAYMILRKLERGELLKVATVHDLEEALRLAEGLYQYWPAEYAAGTPSRVWIYPSTIQPAESMRVSAIRIRLRQRRSGETDAVATREVKA
jgi:hypothetical protein